MSRLRIGLRREDKNPWERRVALTPDAVARLTGAGVEILAERFARRAFDDASYASAGATLVDDVRHADVVLGIKEIPASWFRRDGAYLFFSHTIKGQWFNMPMLARMVDLGCTLIDYERVTDATGRRMIYFSHHAGVAGMIDSLWALGRRLTAMGHENPFDRLRPAHRYPDVGEAREAVRAAGERIRAGEVPDEVRPLTVGFTGSGNVTNGALEIFDLLPFENVAPEELAGWNAAHEHVGDRIGRVRFELHHLVQRADGGFDTREYYATPERYRSRLREFLSHVALFVHGVYWDERYPVFATREDLNAATAPSGRLLAVGDITCDVEGSLACTVRDTEPGDPVYVFDPATGEAPSGFDGPGVAVMAVGNLPTELPIESSETFSDALEPFVEALADLDLGTSFEDADLPDPIRRATILWRGQLTPDFAYLGAELERLGLRAGRTSG
ncbi:MAG TPA: hypothetical protein VKA86_10740 [Candidatus Krumholzibacteria bacterium]|nr:hypothetical protein [Candidatus Krumholzibacteria bacterium]